MRVANAGTLAIVASAATDFSDPFAISNLGPSLLAVTIRRTAGSTAFSVTLQGAWSDSTTSADWVDTGVTASAINVNTPFRVGTTEQAVWQWYRLKLACASDCTVDYRIIDADA